MTTATSPFVHSRLFGIPIETAGDAVALLAHVQGYFPLPGLIATIFTSEHGLAGVALHYAAAAPDPAGLAALDGRSGEPSGTIVAGSGTPEDVGRAVADYARSVAALHSVDQRVCGTAGQVWVLDVDGNAQDPAGVVQPYTETAFSQTAEGRGSTPLWDLAGMRTWLETAPGEQRTRVEAGVAATEYLMDLLMGSPLGDSADMITAMRRAIETAAASSHRTGSIPDAAIAAICALLTDDRMAEMLNAFAQLPDREAVLRVCAELARLAPEHHRAAAATHLGYAAMAHGDPYLAATASEIAAAALANTTSGPSGLEDRGEYLHAVLDTAGLQMRPQTHGASLDVAEAMLRSPVFAVFGISETLALCDVTAASATHRDLSEPATDGSQPVSPAGSGPALRWRGADLTSNAESAPAILRPIESFLPEADLCDHMFPVDIPIDQTLLDGLVEAYAYGTERICLHRTPTGLLIADQAVDAEHHSRHR